MSNFVTVARVKAFDTRKKISSSSLPRSLLSSIVESIIVSFIIIGRIYGIGQDENSMNMNVNANTNMNVNEKSAAPFETVEPTLPLALPFRDSFQHKNEMEIESSPWPYQVHIQKEIWDIKEAKLDEAWDLNEAGEHRPRDRAK
jgi:hypothetical protein